MINKDDNTEASADPAGRIDELVSLRYSSEPPTSKGYYWLKTMADERIVRVRSEPNDSYSVDYSELGMGLSFLCHPRPDVTTISDKMNAKWAGPIERPRAS